MEDRTMNLFENVEALRRNLDHMSAKELRHKYETAYLKKLDMIKEQLLEQMHGVLKGLKVNTADELEIAKMQKIINDQIPFLQESAFVTADSNKLKQQLCELKNSIQTEYKAYQEHAIIIKFNGDEEIEIINYLRGESWNQKTETWEKISSRKETV